LASSIQWIKKIFKDSIYACSHLNKLLVSIEKTLEELISNDASLKESVERLDPQSRFFHNEAHARFVARITDELMVISYEQLDFP